MVATFKERSRSTTAASLAVKDMTVVLDQKDQGGDERRHE